MIFVYKTLEVKPLFYDTCTAAKPLCLYEMEMTCYRTAPAAPVNVEKGGGIPSKTEVVAKLLDRITYTTADEKRRVGDQDQDLVPVPAFSYYYWLRHRIRLLWV